MDNSKMKAVNYLTKYQSKQEWQGYGKRKGWRRPSFVMDEAIGFLENAAITDFSKLKYGENKHDRFKFVEGGKKLHRMHPQEFSSALLGISRVSIHDDNVNTKDKGKRNELHVLCQSNSSPNLIIEIQRLIELGYKVNDKDKGGRNVLHYSCQYNSSPNLVEAIKVFIENGIDAKAKDNDEWNALHYLCRFNSSSDLRNAIQILIKHGIDANEKTNDGCNTLHLLCQNHSTSNFIDAIQILIQQGIDVKEKEKNGRNALFFLIRNSNMDNHLKSNVFRFLIRHGIQVHSENEESFNLYQDFFKENDNCGKICFDFLVKEEIRLGWHDKCENCQQILSITESPRVRLQHHQMFSSCYGVFHLLMKHLEKWAKSNQRPGESELDMSKPTKWLREKAEQYRESETGKSFKEDFEVMADVSEQVKKGSNSSEFNCDHYERYLRSMYSIAGLIECDESMGQIKWFFLLPFDFPIDYGDEKEPDIKRAKIEWDRTLFSWAHKETDEYYGKFRKEDANDGYFLPKEFKHKCHEIDGKSQNHYVEQPPKPQPLPTSNIPLKRGMLETNDNKRMTSTEIAKQMKSIENKLYEKEEELRQLCATDSSPALVQKIRDITSLGIDVNAMDKDGRNALHYLCQHNSSSTLIDAIKLLIELGICIMSNGHDARTILRQHYNKSDIEEIIELLDGASRDEDNQQTFNAPRDPERSLGQSVFFVSLSLLFLIGLRHLTQKFF
ncbi:Uncharacterized protein APZ42_012483 [Daphnia magna]|uniref:Uncharacterized protein n=1 Tax=Daphnia magna TaxID=35525 RepID=A0A162RV05_9CRUS|nr:Uncharacterized protein APZ42_012483 [Daphnia magna]